MRVTCLLIVLFILYVSLSTATAQETFASAGSNIAGSGGSANFTVGQVFFNTHAGISAEVFQGVQIPYEISVVTSVDDAEEINLILRAYPNPTTDYLTLSIDGFDSSDMVFYLLDISGKYIQRSDIKDSETQISMTNLPAQIYFLKVLKGGRELKTFKIVKR